MIARLFASPEHAPVLQPSSARRPLRPVPRPQSGAAHRPGPDVDTRVPHPPTFLRLSAGFVYFYFGFLKFFPDLSPAELLAGETLTRISAHWLSATTALQWLAVMEVAIGLSFLFNFQLRWVFFVFLFHQSSTFLPLFILPELCFKIFPFAPTMEGQYILKNLISVAVGYTVMLPAVKAAWGPGFRRSVSRWSRLVPEAK